MPQQRFLLQQKVLVTAAVLSECGYNGRFQAADSEVHRDGTTGIFRHSQPMRGRVHCQ